MRLNGWSEEEISLLRDLYPNSSKDDILARIKHKWTAIYARAHVLGIARGKAIIRSQLSEANTSWSKEEEELLLSIYPSNTKEYIQERFPEKTWTTVRYRAWQLGLKRSRDLVLKDNADNTRKAVQKKYGVDSCFSLPEVQEKIKSTNLKARGCEYPTQSSDVRERVRSTVRDRYGVGNVFEAKEIQDKISQTNVSKYGMKNPMMNDGVKEKAVKTNKERYGVDNPFQMTDRVKKGMVEKYGQEVPLRCPEIRAKWVNTNVEKYGVPYPSQNSEVKEKIKEVLNTPEVREKKLLALKAAGKEQSSGEEETFYSVLTALYGEVKQREIHPILKQSIDFYIPAHDMWVQYDGVYWHSKNGVEGEGRQAESRKKILERDSLQNALIPNLVRFWSDDVLRETKNGNILEYVKNKISDAMNSMLKVQVCHQYTKKTQTIQEDLKALLFDPSTLSAADFVLAAEKLTTEVILFITRYEWLGTIGQNPKWCFTARYQGILSGVVLVNEPTSYSALLGSGTPKYEALIQRGATISWAPKNLGSRLVMFACRWMVQNTEKRVFVGYADPRAGERGIIYRSCNFEYLGDSFGDAYVYRHTSKDKLFSARSLRRTSSFISWCKRNNVLVDPSWIRENGFKDMSKVPYAIKKRWYEDVKRVLSESQKIGIVHKMKYALVRGRDRRDQKYLDSLKTYRGKPYPGNIIPVVSTVSIPTGITISRKTAEKIEYIKKNYATMPRAELAKDLNESPRWVKRQLNTLRKEGAISKSATQPHPLILSS